MVVFVDYFYFPVKYSCSRCVAYSLKRLVDLLIRSLFYHVILRILSSSTFMTDVLNMVKSREDLVFYVCWSITVYATITRRFSCCWYYASIFFCGGFPHFVKVLILYLSRFYFKRIIMKSDIKYITFINWNCSVSYKFPQAKVLELFSILNFKKKKKKKLYRIIFSFFFFVNIIKKLLKNILRWSISKTLSSDIIFIWWK